MRADRDVRAGETYRDGTIPYQRFRAWQLAGQTAGIVGLGAVGRAATLALRRSRHARDRARPVRTTRRRTRSTTCSPRPTSCRCTRWSRPRPQGMIGAEQFARMREGAIYLNTARAALHDTDALVAALRRRPRSAAPASTTSSASASPPTIRSARWTTSCSRRTSVARPTTPRPTTRADRRRPRHAARRRHARPTS